VPLSAVGLEFGTGNLIRRMKEICSQNSGFDEKIMERASLTNQTGPTAEKRPPLFLVLC
jgi:hypothetical protein